MRTVADYYMEQGFAKGEARGIAKGEARGEARGLAKGEAIGLEKKALVIARNLLKAGISTEVISRSTGLSVSEIKKIKSSPL